MLTVLALAACCLSCASPSLLPWSDAQPEIGRYAPPPAATAPDSITVVSYNIQYAEHISQAIVDIRADRRLALADIYLLQEMDPAGTERIARALGCDFVYFPASVQRHTGRLFGNAVLSRWPIRGSRVIILPHPSPVDGTRRIALDASITLGDRVLNALSVHQATVVVSQHDRFDQTEMVADCVSGLPGPVIVGGDFNTVTHWEVVATRRRLRRAGLREAALPPGATNRKAIARVLGLENALDHIYVRGLVPLGTGVAREASASDHWPVWATVSVAAADSG